MYIYRNVYYLVLGVVLGAVLGILVCDETKKEIIKAIQNKAKFFSDNCKATSEEAMDSVKGSVNSARSSLKDLL
ncbi:YtxH domain-containing protein [Candidatus Cardinium hertigii]|jgi:hypothetical protein|uniref:YtxH domain-containing protein n=1 Tax=Candidatus Cardinium hertigii TaxID=247481 RepID=A0A3N2QBJ9_9BACT|nr:YtxH domain-containing protein [Candidatus Cardinium hertigii]ROT47198.1 YtxH domain-containing protein [Candidatus Cardinium hertigii]ROT47209.1 YtxH domain-containing protein [Candidatus Cardinium hertigii]ROT47427.1 YtxH domain-containing protein [Candidatus Cardinium hertigii]